MGEKEEKDKHDAKLVKSFEQGLEDLVKGGFGLPWNHPDRKVDPEQKTPEMI
jgi:hypothetical protein